MFETLLMQACFFFNSTLYFQRSCVHLLHKHLPFTAKKKVQITCRSELLLLQSASPSLAVFLKLQTHIYFLFIQDFNLSCRCLFVFFLKSWERKKPLNERLQLQTFLPIEYGPRLSVYCEHGMCTRKYSAHQIVSRAHEKPSGVHQKISWLYFSL